MQAAKYRRGNSQDNQIININTHPLFKPSKPITHLTNHDASPIKDKEVIEQIKQHLLSTGRYGHRNWLIFLVGINSGRRCGDLLNLTIGDLVDPTTGDIVSTLTKKEGKTGKKFTYVFPDPIRDAIRDYLTTRGFYSLDEPLFKGQKNERKVQNKDGSYSIVTGGFMATSTYWGILQNIKKELGIKFRLSAHSLRKTFAYHKYMYLKTVSLPEGHTPIDLVQHELMHNSAKTTMKYIGITDEVRVDLYNNAVL